MCKKRQSGRLPASALVTVLVICTLILLLVSGVFMLWSTDLYQISAYRYKRQRQMYIDSAFLLYERDSISAVAMQSDSVFLLFHEEKTSGIRLKEKDWGLYKQVHIMTEDGEQGSVRMFGKAMPATINPVLWMADNKNSISLSGNTNIKGKMWLPTGGLHYTQMNHLFFRGTKIDKEDVFFSENELPEILSAWPEPQGEFSANLPEYNSFKDETLYAYVDGTQPLRTMRGNIIIRSDSLTIDHTVHLSDVIVSASSIRLKSGFTGNLQIYATDSVVLDSNVILEYPSGVFLKADNTHAIVRIGENCEVNGYIIVEAKTDLSENILPNYMQHETASLRGLLRVNGIAQLQGVVAGSSWLKHCFYFSDQGYYIDMLYDISLQEDKEIAYPFLHSAIYERRCIKWLY